MPNQFSQRLGPSALCAGCEGQDRGYDLDGQLHQRQQQLESPRQAYSSLAVDLMSASLQSGPDCPLWLSMGRSRLVESLSLVESL